MQYVWTRTEIPCYNYYCTLIDCSTECFIVCYEIFRRGYFCLTCTGDLGSTMKLIKDGRVRPTVGVE